MFHWFSFYSKPNAPTKCSRLCLYTVTKSDVNEGSYLLCTVIDFMEMNYFAFGIPSFYWHVWLITLICNTGWLKSYATHSWHMFCLSKNNLHWNQKTKKKNNVIQSVENLHCAQRCIHSIFSSCLMQPVEEFLSHGNGWLDDTLLICLEQENQEMYP
jgi:hypothetical protein